MQDIIALEEGSLIVKEGESFIVYNPFNGKITRTEQSPKTDTDLYQYLEKSGFFSGPPSNTQYTEEWKGFHSLTLLMTRSCNLGCSYCYAKAKPGGANMPAKLALDSVDWFMNQLNSDIVRITFHGGGEPTLQFDLIQDVVRHIEESKGQKQSRYLITTNGTADQQMWDWMINNKFGISISMDGPPEIQNRNRPLATTGGASSDLVENSIRYLVKQKYPFTIRMTYSPVDDIESIVRYFAGLGVKSIHLEPLFPHGRDYETVEFGKKSNYSVYSPHGAELLKKFFQAVDVCKELGIKIYNGHLVNFTRGVGYFCGSASAKSMVVTHDGYISGCLEVVDQKDQDASTFFLGRYLEESGQFEVNLDKIDFLQKRHADLLPECSTCHARYHCAGGCSVKAVRASGNFYDRDIPYCSFTKAIVPELVRRIALASGI